VFQRVSFLYLSSAILSHLLALGHVLLLRQRGPLDLFLAGLTVPTHALGCVQFPVAKQVCCGDPRLVLQNTSPHSDRPFSAGQANVFLRITAARHPHSTCAHAPCCQSFGGLYKAIQSSVYIIKSARACGEAIYYYTPPPPRSPTARVRKLFQTVSKTRSRIIFSGARSITISRTNCTASLDSAHVVELLRLSVHQSV